MNKQIRFTKQKQIVFNAVVSRCDHPTAEDIYESIHKEFPKISLSTVYRNLLVLANAGLIKKVQTSGADHFDLTIKNHYHVICSCCHKLIDTNIPYDNQIDKKAAKETGFAIKHHHLIIEGVCPECLNKLKSKEDDKQ